MVRLLASLLLASVVAAHAVPRLEQGLAAHLPMKADLLDHAEKSLPVQVHGQVEVRGGAAFFGGREDWIELPFIPLHDRPFSVGVWLKPTGVETTLGVLEQFERNETGHILHLMIRDGLRPWFGFYGNDVVSPVSISNAGEWNHVVFRYDGRNQQIWINGRLVCQRAANAYRGTGGKTRIGKNPGWNNVPTHNFEGWMSDFRIYDRAVSFEEIIVLAGARPAAATAGVPAKTAPGAQPAGSVAPAGMSDVPVLSLDASRLRLRGQPGQQYIVEATEDLEQWREIGILTVGVEGVVEFVDDDALLLPQRFYRIRYRLPD